MTLTVGFDSRGLVGREALQKLQVQFGAASDVKVDVAREELSAVWRDTRRDLVNHLVTLIEDGVTVQQIAIINK